MASNETIENRVVERLKKQPLGDLITEEDLFDIVKTAIPRAFFEDREVRDGYHSRREPAPIVAVVKAALKDAIQVAVDRWAVENADKLAEFWRPVFENNIVAWVQEQQGAMVRRHVGEVLSKTTQMWNEERQRAGLPPLPVIY